MRFITAFTCLLLAGWFVEDQLQPPQQYVCYRAGEALRVDGRLDEPAWIQARQSPAFTDIVTGEPAWLSTSVALLWDDQFLYFGYRVEEPDVRAELTVRDSKIWSENDVELFIAGQDAYYELEINALNTIYEVFWIWKDVLKPGSQYYGRPEFDPETKRVMTLAGVGGHVHPRGERWGFLDWDFPGLQHAVEVQGTLNNSVDSDRGWTVELALPWEGLKLLADGRSLPPEDGDEWRIDCSRFQLVDAEGKRLKRSAGWTWTQHGFYDSHIPERFSIVEFSKQQLPEAGPQEGSSGW
jgi:hypothetical protein